jgi:hypothetical protein
MFYFEFLGNEYRTDKEAKVIERNDGTAEKPRWTRTYSMRVFVEAIRVIDQYPKMPGD